MSVSRASPEACTVLRYSRCSGVSSVSSASSVMPMMPFMGVRISWLMLARMFLLARLAALGRFLGPRHSALPSANSAVRCSTPDFQLVVCCPAQFLLDPLQLRDIVHRYHGPGFLPVAVQQRLSAGQQGARQAPVSGQLPFLHCGDIAPKCAKRRNLSVRILVLPSGEYVR